jgi:hypothetical protein
MLRLFLPDSRQDSVAKKKCKDCSGLLFGVILAVVIVMGILFLPSLKDYTLAAVSSTAETH